MKRMMILLGVVIAFWNVENFFDFRPDGTSDSELEFSATGARRWGKRRFYAKCDGIAKTLLRLSDVLGQLPDAVGLAEVEGGFALRQLTGQTVLHKLDYRIVHFESHDSRGIDCALLYRSSRLRLLEAWPEAIVAGPGDTLATRDLLCCRFTDSDGDTLGVIVVHLPSQVGGDAARPRRELALATLREQARRMGCPTVCIGDFNEEADPAQDLAPLQDLSLPLQERGVGTIRYNGVWELIDRCLVLGCRTASMGIFDDPMLCTRDGAFGGVKPLRTYSGPRHIGGLSDHFPIWAEVTY